MKNTNKLCVIFRVCSVASYMMINGLRYTKMTDYKVCYFVLRR